MYEEVQFRTVGLNDVDIEKYDMQIIHQEFCSLFTFQNRTRKVLSEMLAGNSNK